MCYELFNFDISDLPLKFNQLKKNQLRWLKDTLLLNKNN